MPFTVDLGFYKPVIADLFRRPRDLNNNWDIADNLGATAKPWTPYDIKWLSSDNDNQHVLGDGIVIGRYLQIYRLMIISILLQFSTNTTVGLGDWGFTLPRATLLPRNSSNINPANTSRFKRVHPFWAWDNSGSTGRALFGTVNQSFNFGPDPHNLFHVVVRQDNVALGSLSATSPFTWANGDKLVGHVVYIHGEDIQT